MAGGIVAGQPTLYKPEYCEMLIKHMKEGNSFESFGAIVHTCRTTLYNWTREHSEFLYAKNMGKEYSLKFYEDIGKMGAMGQLRRITKETVVRDKAGNVVFDKQGNALYDREYEATTPAQGMWAMLMKNMHDYSDRRVIEGDPEKPIRHTHELASGEKLKEIREATKLLEELGYDDAKIDSMREYKNEQDE